ncbi:MAG: prepilin-type N-terminal cleavage/methylation domain-containing protein [Gemmatimonadaceae bacterium]
MYTRNRSRRRAGITMIEMLVAITIMLAVFGLAVPFFKVQVRSLGAHANRMDAQQNARFVLTSIERELRVAGVGIADKQPLIVQADPYAVTFNADLVTKDPGDPGAVYLDVDADPAGLTVLKHTSAVKLPRTPFSYPESTYFGAKGLESRAETVSYWVAPDSARPGEWIMWRRVNNTPPRVVTQGLVIASGVPVFRYFKFDVNGQPVEIDGSRLPLIHSAAIHDSPADTAKSALTDSIRTVRIDVTTRVNDPDKGVVTRSLQSTVRVVNAGLVNYTVCGDPPLGTALVGTPNLLPKNPRQVTLTWLPSLDEVAGEKDVMRYALYRRPQGAADWGEPFASVAAGLANYQYVDKNVKKDDKWEYAIVAQDCTPNSSDLMSTGVINVP